MRRDSVASAAQTLQGRFRDAFPGLRAAEWGAINIPAAAANHRGLPRAEADATAGASGHPIGVEGARLPVTLLPALAWRVLPHGIAALGGAGGRAAALPRPGLH
jgi:hypothetical protein